MPSTSVSPNAGDDHDRQAARDDIAQPERPDRRGLRGNGAVRGPQFHREQRIGDAQSPPPPRCRSTALVTVAPAVDQQPPFHPVDPRAGPEMPVGRHRNPDLVAYDALVIQA